MLDCYSCRHVETDNDKIMLLFDILAVLIIFLITYQKLRTRALVYPVSNRSKSEITKSLLPLPTLLSL